MWREMLLGSDDRQNRTDALHKRQTQHPEHIHIHSSQLRPTTNAYNEVLPASSLVTVHGVQLLMCPLCVFVGAGHDVLCGCCIRSVFVLRIAALPHMHEVLYINDTLLLV
jgi:hypothetical protein